MLDFFLASFSVMKGLSNLLTLSMGIRLDLQPSNTGSDGIMPRSSLSTINHQLREAGKYESPRLSSSSAELWSSNVIKVEVSVPETGASGILHIDPGGAYGARQLAFPRRGRKDDSGSRGRRVELPSVSLGLMWRWPGGRAEGLPALFELLHEVGHGLHLILSNSGGGPAEEEDGNRNCFKHFGGIHLPLDFLEVPSTLMEQMAMHPACLQVRPRDLALNAWLTRVCLIRIRRLRLLLHRCLCR